MQKNSNKKLAYINIIIGSLVNIVILIISLVRTFLINDVFSIGDFGLLNIALSIIPYLTSTVGCITTYSGIYLIKSYNLGDYNSLNKQIAQIIRVWRKRFIYYVFSTILVSILFPFIIGEWHTGDDWLNALLVFANSLGSTMMYIVLPIELIILTIMRKTYLRSLIQVACYTIVNVFIFTYLILEKQYHFISVKSTWNLIIILGLQGLSTFFITFTARMMRKKIMPWYKRVKETENFSNGEKRNIKYIWISSFFSQLVLNADLFMLAVYSNFAKNALDIAGIYAIYLMSANAIMDFAKTMINAPMYSMAKQHTDNNGKISFEAISLYEDVGIFIGFMAMAAGPVIMPLISSVISGENKYYYPWLGLVLMVPSLIMMIKQPLENFLSINKEFKVKSSLSLVEVIINIIISSIGLIIAYYLARTNIVLTMTLLVLGTSLALFVRHICLYVYIHKNYFPKSHTIIFYIKRLIAPYVIVLSINSVSAYLMSSFIHLYSQNSQFNIVRFNIQWWEIMGDHILTIFVLAVIYFSIGLIILREWQHEFVELFKYGITFLRKPFKKLENNDKAHND